MQSFRPSFCSQLKTLVYKNWLIKLREPFTSLLEVLVPLIVVIILVVVKGLKELRVQHSPVTYFDVILF